MGCCLSATNKTTPSSLQKSPSLNQPKSSNQDSRAPPPSFEEETVKEVLSEVPKPPPSTPSPIKKNPLPVADNYADPIFVVDKDVKNDKNVVFQEAAVSEQDVSEICSLSCSESVSTTTFNNDNKRYDLEDEVDDDDEVKQRVMRSPAPKLPQRNRSFQGYSGHRQDRSLPGKSPTRRSDQSPVKRNNAGGAGSVRLVQSREAGSGQMGRRGSKRDDPNRRDPGERSSRRSRSPANNRSAVTRSPSVRRTNPSPGRVRTDPNEIGSSKRVQNGIEDTWPSRNNGGVTDESLENPLVSLECFIFL